MQAFAGPTPASRIQYLTGTVPAVPFGDRERPAVTPDGAGKWRPYFGAVFPKGEITGKDPVVLFGHPPRQREEGES